MFIGIRAAQKLVDRRAEARPEASLLVLVDARRLARRRPRLGVHRISHVHLPQVEIVVETNEDFEAAVAVAADGGVGVKDAATRGRIAIRAWVTFREAFRVRHQGEQRNMMEHGESLK